MMWLGRKRAREEAQVIERIQNKPENTERNVILQCKKQKSVTKKLLCVLASVFG